MLTDLIRQAAALIRYPLLGKFPLLADHAQCEYNQDYARENNSDQKQKDLFSMTS